MLQWLRLADTFIRIISKNTLNQSVKLLKKTDSFELKDQIEVELKVVQKILHNKQHEAAKIWKEESLLAMQASSPLRSDPACIASNNLTVNQDARVS